MNPFSLLSGGGAEKADLPALIRQGALLIDARSPAEFSSGTIPGSINLPHMETALRIGSIERNKERPIVVYCHSGIRSAMAVSMLKKEGYTCVVNGGGIRKLRRQLEDSHD